MWIAFRSDEVLDDLGRDTLYRAYLNYGETSSDLGWRDYVRITDEDESELIEALQAGKLVATGKQTELHSAFESIPAYYWIEGNFGVTEPDKTRGAVPRYVDVRIASIEMRRNWPSNTQTRRGGPTPRKPKEAVRRHLDEKVATWGPVRPGLDGWAGRSDVIAVGREKLAEFEEDASDSWFDKNFSNYWKNNE